MSLLTGPSHSNSIFAPEDRIILGDVSVNYRLPRERVSSFKEFAIRKLQRRLEYIEFRALQNINIKVKHGETLGIIGFNGAGKSTLLKVISRVLHPTSGRVVIKGRVAPLLELGAAFHPELTGRENIFLNGVLLGRKNQEMEDRFEDIVEFAGLRDFIDVPVRTYSSGMLARLAFSVATEVDPDILLIDEILSVGDSSFAKKSQARIRQFQDNGVAVVLVSHTLSSLQELCNRVIWLDRGKIVEDGDPERIIQSYLRQSNISTVTLPPKDVKSSAPGLEGSDYAAKAGVWFAGTEQNALFIPRSKVITPIYEDKVDGPIKIQVKNSDLLFTSQRVLYGNSFNEIMGFPSEQLTSTYWYPWYDQMSMQSWLLISNPSDAQPVDVRVLIAGTERGSYRIEPLSTIKVQFDGISGGPVQVSSTNGQPILSSQRVVYGGSFNEIMGYPGSQLTNEYWFSWYDQMSMQNWLLLSNPESAHSADVRVLIAGAKQGDYRIEPMKTIKLQFDGIVGGPVQVISINGQSILSSQRTLHCGSFNEVIGYPGDKLTTEYWHPWYDDRIMKTNLLITNPNDTVSSEVDVFISGQKEQTHILEPLSTIKCQFSGLTNGPIRVVNNNGKAIFTSMHGYYGDGFSEVFGFPGNQLSGEHWFPKYDNVNMRTWLLLGTP